MFVNIDDLWPGDIVKDKSGTFQVSDVVKREDHYVIKYAWHTGPYTLGCYHLKDKLNLNFAANNGKYGSKLRKVKKDEN